MRCRISRSTLILFVFIATTISASRSAWAQQCTAPGTTVFYVNGLFNDRTQAKKSLEELRTQFETHLPNTSLASECFEFALAFDRGPLVNLLDATLQKLGGDLASFWRVLASLEPAPDWFQQAALNIATALDPRTYVIGTDLQSHVQDYRSDMFRGNRVLAVSHSHGNLYTNDAHKELYNGLDGLPPLVTRSFGLVAVATPASTTAGNGPHTTLFGDLVIDQIISVMLPAAIIDTSFAPFVPRLPNTLGGFPLSTDLLGHSFVKAYLEGNNSQTKILNDMVNVIGTLERPPARIFADAVVSFTPGYGATGDPNSALGPPDGPNVGLGLGGQITLRLSSPFVIDGPAALRVNSAKPDSGSMELDNRADVFASPDGASFLFVGSVGRGGPSFFVDLSATGFSQVRFVRIVDSGFCCLSGNPTGGLDGFNVESVEATSSIPLPPPPPR